MLLEDGKLSFDLAAGGISFDEANYGAGSHLERYGNEEMDMVIVVVAEIDGMIASSFLWGYHPFRVYERR